MAAYISHFLIGGIPAALLFCCFYPYRKRALTAQHLLSETVREAALILFVTCLFGLAAMVLWPGYHWEESDGLWGNLVILNARKSWSSNMNLIPFRMISEYIHYFQTGHLYLGILFLFGNLGTFIPLGFFPPLLFREAGKKHVFLSGFGFSMSAEVLQFFLGRHCDVDDVILNVLGTFFGYWLYLLFRKCFPALSARFHCQKIS